MLELKKLPGWNQLICYVSKKNTPYFLVGGAVRDLLLERPIRDIDILVPSNAKQESLRFGRKYSYPTFPLHAEMGIHRVVPEKGFYIDFADYQGKTLEEDLRRRDFSINALAIDLRDIHTISDKSILEEKVIDLCNGLSDLKERRISVLNNETIIDDPLRLVRIFRFHAQLDFSLSEQTKSMVKEYFPLINTIANERIYQELALLFSHNHRSAITSFIDSRLWQAIIEKAFEGNCQIIPGSIRKSLIRWFFYQELREEIKKKHPRYESWLNSLFQKELAGNISLGSLFSLFCLLPEQSVAPNIEKFGRQLTLSKQAIMVIRQWIEASEKVLSLRAHGQLQEVSSIRRLLFQYSESLVPALFYVLSSGNVNVSSVQGISIIRHTIDEWNGTTVEQKELLSKVNGHLISEITNLKPGKLLGQILRETHEKIYLGEFENYDQVLHFLRSQMQEMT